MGSVDLVVSVESVEGPAEGEAFPGFRPDDETAESTETTETSSARSAESAWGSGAASSRQDLLACSLCVSDVWNSHARSSKDGT